MIKVVVFDLDDTLISEKEYIKSGYRHISKIIHQKYMLPPDRTYKELLLLMSENFKNVFNRLLDNYKINYNMSDISFMVDKYRNHIPDISFYEDVMPILKWLNGMGIKTAIITDGYTVTQKNKLEALRAYHVFDKIIITDELGREYWKPHAKAFEIIREFFGIDYHEMMYIGDNPEKDFYIAKTHPIKTVRIVRQDCVYKSREYLENISETYRINTLEEIKQISTCFL